MVNKRIIGDRIRMGGDIGLSSCSASPVGGKPALTLSLGGVALGIWPEPWRVVGGRLEGSPGGHTTPALVVAKKPKIDP